MKYYDFIEAVKIQADMESWGVAERVTAAALQTLGESLPQKEREDLADQLAGGLKEQVLNKQDRPTLSAEEFYERVSTRADTDYYETIKLVRAMISMLKKAVSRGELNDVFSSLPDGVKPLLKED